MIARGAILACILALVGAGGAWATTTLSGVDEERARTLMREFACIVCNGQSIDDSEAPAAAEMRARVRASVQAGLSDGEIRAEIARVYGDAAVLRPPMRGGAIALWFAPIAIIALAVGLVWVTLGRKAPDGAADPGDDAIR